MERGLPDFLFVCTGPTCGERGGREIQRAWKEALLDRGAWDRTRVVPVACFGLCALGPNACLASSGRFLEAIDPRRPQEALERLVEAS